MGFEFRDYYETKSKYYTAARDIAFSQILAKWHQKTRYANNWREKMVRLVGMFLRKKKEEASGLKKAVLSRLKNRPEFYDFLESNRLLRFDLNQDGKALEKIARKNEFNPDIYASVVDNLRKSSALINICELADLNGVVRKKEGVDIKVFLDAINHFVNFAYPLFLQEMEMVRQKLQYGRTFESKSGEVAFLNFLRIEELKNWMREIGCKIDHTASELKESKSKEEQTLQDQFSPDYGFWVNKQHHLMTVL